MINHAFDFQRVLLLYGEKGTGKTSSAIEFARWSANTGFMGDQPIMYTSLQYCINITDLLEDFGQVYKEALRERNVIWNELEDHQRIKLIKDLCKKVPLLWIWDDYESVSQNQYGLWDKDERDQLEDLIRALTDKAARLLIISTDSENTLGEEVIRFKIPTLAHSSIKAVISAYSKKHPTPEISAECVQQIYIFGTENLKVLDVLLKHPALLDKEFLAGPPDVIINAFLSSISLEDQRVIALTT